MSGMPPKVTPLAALVKKYEEGASMALAAGRNEIVTQIYARGANAIRAMARDPRHRREQFEIEQVAAHFDLLASQSNIPYVDPTFSDFPFVDDWSDDNPQLPTEFDGVVADFGDAKLLPDGSPADELEASAQFSSFQKARKYQVSRPVQITPESANNDGNLFSSTVLVQFGSGGSSAGGSYTHGILSAGVSAKQEAEIIRWDGNGDSESVPCRIAVSRITGGASATYPTGVQSPGTVYNYRPFLHILWGAGERGTYNEAYVDVGMGTQITINASHVYANVGMDAFASNVGGNTNIPGSMYLTGNLGFFNGSSQAPITRTVYIDQLADGSSTTVAVPAFAHYLLPPQIGVAGGAGLVITLNFLDAGGGTIYSLVGARGTFTAPIPIGNDIVSVQVVNGTGDNADYRLIFQLCL